MASGSTYPPAPEYYRLCATEQGLSPPPPIDGDYTVFGQTANSSVTLPKLQGRDLIQYQPDGSVDYEANLVRLNRELVAALQELMDALEKTPSQSARELETVLAIQNNLMHLCNMLRPVQARATLKHALRQAVQQKQAILSKLAESRQGVHDASAAAVTSLGAGA